ncbi:MAG: ATP-binding protein, partial [Sulfurovum sp.]|nr:ATP-binding protein [Sulfurovum sp.]
FDNLLVNAMKYSSKEMPIEIRLTNDTLKIIDRGIGMDETQIVKVFEHYYQGDIRQKGEGIGLALVKAFCDGEKITITINSQKDKGTEVILDLTKIIHTLL